jgi:hypothetical protein
MHDIKDDINYDIIHDFRVCIPTSDNALGRVLKSLLASSNSASSKSATVVCLTLSDSVVLLDKAWLVLCVRLIQTVDVRRRESQSVL